VSGEGSGAPWAAEELAAFAVGPSPGDLPATAREMARQCLVDLFGAAWAGHRTPAAGATRALSRSLLAAGPASVWFTGERRCAAGAALANAAAASALDLDDGHRGAAGHPGAAILPACLAVAEEQGTSGPELLAAIAVGYEVACRVGAARDFARLPTLSTGRWAAYGVAAAAGRLRRLPAAVIAQALAVAGVLSPDLAAAGYSGVMGNSAKEGIPWATLTGLAAVDLAAAGFTGPLDLLDHPEYFRRERLLAGLGREWQIERVYFKPYSCCRWIHAALDALVALQGQHRLRAESIDRIRVETFERALRLNPYPDPASLEAAQYSLPFCLAVSVLEGPQAFLPLEEEVLGRPDLVALARKVELAVDPRLDELFPTHVPARVLVEAGGVRLEKLVVDPLGDPANPLSPERLRNKFRRLSGSGVPLSGQEALLEAVEGIEEQGGVERLCSCLKKS